MLPRCFRGDFGCSFSIAVVRIGDHFTINNERFALRSPLRKLREIGSAQPSARVSNAKNSIQTTVWPGQRLGWLRIAVTRAARHKRAGYAQGSGGMRRAVERALPAITDCRWHWSGAMATEREPDSELGPEGGRPAHLQGLLPEERAHSGSRRFSHYWRSERSSPGVSRVWSLSSIGNRQEGRQRGGKQQI